MKKNEKRLLEIIRQYDEYQETIENEVEYQKDIDELIGDSALLDEVIFLVKDYLKIKTA